MPPSWRQLAAGSSAKLSSIKETLGQYDYHSLLEGRRILKPGDPGYVDGGEAKQGWREWAGEKMRRRNTQNIEPGSEQIVMFPGWSTRSYLSDEAEDSSQGGLPAHGQRPFDLDIFVTGYAATQRPADLNSQSRRHRAFMRVARAYASLGSLPDPSTPAEQNAGFGLDVPLTTPPESLLESDLNALENEFNEAKREDEILEGDLPQPPRYTESPPPSLPPSPDEPVPRRTSPLGLPLSNGLRQPNQHDQRQLHANLHERLRPFWSNSLSNRTVHLSFFASRQGVSLPNMLDPSTFSIDRLLATYDLTTSPKGLFRGNFRIPWAKLRNNPNSSHLALDTSDDEQNVIVLAELMPPPIPAATPNREGGDPFQGLPEVTAQAAIVIPVSNAQVRVISDIDDTVKFSNILGGARAAFHNVFVKNLHDLVIDGMGEWYTSLWARGVRFHYVSNSPMELFPVINEFLKISQLPEGSIKLKSYSGSFFKEMFSAPASRKRDGVVEVINSFKSSRFILVGDSGEQDLELYATLAHERPQQVLAVFIRDARNPDSSNPLTDPTGENIRAMSMPGYSRASTDSSASSSSLSSQLSGLELNEQDGTIRPSLPRGNSSWRALLRSQGRGNGNGTTNGQDIPAVAGSSGVAEARNDSRFLHPSRALTLNMPTVQSPKPISEDTTPLANPPSHTATRTSSVPIPASANPRLAASQTVSAPPYFTENGLTSSPPTPSSLSSNNSFNLDGGIPDNRVPGWMPPNAVQQLSPKERKTYELQIRVYKARLRIPTHIPLRIFRDPKECTEAMHVLDDLHKRS